MRRRVCAPAVVLLSVLALTSCDGFRLAPGDDHVCTAEFVHGLRVEVRDAVTGAAAGSGATVRASATGFTESLQPLPEQDGEVSRFHGVGERPGVYTVSVVRPGYEPWSASGVTIGHDECHVIPVNLVVELTPIE